MDAKTIKSELKNAREAIRNKDFKEAMKYCKTILQIDKDNYNALVFVGVATQELDQPESALKAFRKAISINSEQPLAWQGLATFYEKSSNSQPCSELVEVYNKLIQFSSENEKTYEWTNKLFKLLIQLGNTVQVVETFDKLLILCENDNDKELPCWNNLARFLSEQENLTEDNLAMLEEAYSILVREVTDENHLRNLESYIKVLLKRGKEDEAEDQCMKTVVDYPDSVYVFETLCQLYLERNIELTYPPSDIVAASEQLLLLDDSAGAGHIIQGLVNMINRDLLNARDHLNIGVKLCPQKPLAWFHLARAHLMLHNYPKAEKTAAQGLKLFKAQINNSKVLYRELCLVLSKALRDQALPSTLEQALTILNKLLLDYEDNVDVLSALGHTYLTNGEDDKALEICKQGPDDDPQLLAVQSLLYFKKQEYTEAELCIQAAISYSVDEDPWLLYHLGRILWAKSTNKEGKKKCAVYYLKAAKLDPYFSDIFLYLGHFYKEIGNDLEKAKRCYQKAFELDRSNNEAGAALSDVLRSLGDEESNLALLSLVTTEAHSGTAKWAWLRLGLHYVKTNEPNSAVTALQNAIRIDPTDSCCWECLAEAYLTRGSFTASLKAFTRALELNPSSVYCLYQMAAIKHLLGSHTEAETEYKAILGCSPDYVPALCGLAQSLLAQAQLSLTKYFSGRTLDFCQQAIFILTRAVLLSPDISCLWKCLGDACTLLHCLPSESIHLTIPSKILHRSSPASENCTMGKLEVLALGARCYGRALRVLPELASLWHDLGENYFRQAENSPTVQANELITKALDALKKSISLEPHNPKYWNSLGVITASSVENDLALAQHAFIKSIQIEANNVVAWTNLGALYLKANNIELAHQAFKVAQALEPSYVSCWIGQAIIADTIGHEDAMDLFRHTTELAPHTEGGIGYGNWVCKTLLDERLCNTQHYKTNIIEMRAIPQACLNLAKYTGRCQTNACAFNMYGLLLEQEGLNICAAKAFHKAIQLLENESPTKKLDCARLNYARVLSALGRVDEAIKQYQKIHSAADYNSVCGLALAMYKADKLRESFQMYEQAIKLSSSDADTSHTLAALALVAYKMGNFSEAKTAFFQSFQKSPVSVPGLHGLCALGILNNDTTLAEATTQELLKLPWSNNYGSDTCFLFTCLSYIQNDNRSAQNHLAKMIHQYPTCASLWLQQSEYLLRFNTNSAFAAARSASSAELFLFNLSKVLPFVVSLCYLAAGIIDDALKSAQKAVHLYPDALQNWSVLAIASYAKAVVHQSTKKFSITLKLFHFISPQVQEDAKLNLSESSPLILWKTYMLYIVLINLYLQRWTESDKLINQLSIICQAGDTELLNSVRFFLCLKESLLSAHRGCLKDAPFDDLKRAVKACPKSSFVLETISLLFNAAGESNEVQSFLKPWLQKVLLDTPQKKLGPLMLVALLAFKQAKESKEKAKLCYDTIAEVLKINPRCSSAYFIQAMLQMQERKKSAKKIFEKALENKDNYSFLEPLQLASYYLEKLQKN